MEETNAGNNNTGKRAGEAQEQGHSSAKRLKCSIEAEAFCCDVCSKPLTSPIFQKIAYCDRYAHELRCPHAPWRCPEPGCGGFAGKRAAELLEHLTGHHKWPSMAFKYWVPFDLHVVEPGTHVLECKDDGQLFLLSVQPSEPAGLAVSLVSVHHLLTKRNTVGCSVSFSNSRRHYSTSTLDAVRPWWHFAWPPTEYICFVPKVSAGTHDHAGFVLTHFGEPPMEEYIRFVSKVSDGAKDDDAVVLTINITAVQENDDDSDDSSFDYEFSDEEDYDGEEDEDDRT
ncbi:hypothetical protein HU200_002013 [Digitaria exilis]|uniref:RING-type E3 ubiquitin transferase n=1 Tax=Digitaria exilis TaxID=1010633 RepID=A0A835FWG5_9POAL|nr:hypothetical protein HU200_002013 [Digitaria exilis]